MMPIRISAKPSIIIDSAKLHRLVTILNVVAHSFNAKEFQTLVAPIVPSTPRPSTLSEFLELLDPGSLAHFKTFVFSPYSTAVEIAASLNGQLVSTNWSAGMALIIVADTAAAVAAVAVAAAAATKTPAALMHAVIHGGFHGAHAVMPGGFPGAHVVIHGGFPGLHAVMHGGGFPGTHAVMHGGGFPGTHAVMHSGGFSSGHTGYVPPPLDIHPGIPRGFKLGGPVVARRH